MIQTYTLSLIVITINPEVAGARPWEGIFELEWDAVEPTGAEWPPWSDYDRLTISGKAAALWGEVSGVRPMVGTVEVEAGEPSEETRLRMLGPDIDGILTFVSGLMSGPALVGEVGQRMFTARPLASDEPPEPPKLAA